MLLLGIDIGTSSCKAELRDEDGTVLASHSEGYQLYFPFPGCVEQDAEEWWTSTCRCIRAIMERSGCDPNKIAGIGIDGQSWSAIPVDSDGNVLARTPIWMDTRAESLCERVRERLGADALFSVSGNPFYASYTLPKLLYWMDEQPELVKRTDKVLQSNSYIVYRLTGVISQDLSQCYGWQNYDVENRRYDEAMTRALGIDKRFLIEPVASDHVVARVNKEAAALCGLVEGIPVVAGGLDAACAALGVGVIDPGQIQEQGGQASGISICTNSPIRHRKLILSSHVIPDRWLLQGGTVAGGASVNWFAQNLGGMKDGVLTNQGDDVFEKLSAEAEKSPAGANGLIFLPYLNGERSPIWDAKARGMYFGLKLKTTHADMIRAVMEGVGFALRHNLETASETGISIHELRPMGGAAHSVIWTQIKSDITGCRMRVAGVKNATTCGAAMLAGVGVGMYANYEAAAKKLVEIERVQEPEKRSKAQYDASYAVYRQLYQETKGMMHQIADMEGDAI